MSIRDLTEKSSASARINAKDRDRDKTDTDAVTSCVESSDEGNSPITEEEMVIHKIHTEACEAQKQMYIDPGSGYKVFTEFAHRERGRCCGGACRHCPFGQVNVKDPALKKRFNSFFYV